MATLDTNDINATSASLTVTTEKTFTLYVFDKTGSHKNHFVGLEATPDSTNWSPLPNPVKGAGTQTHTIAASKIRAAVLEAEGETSTVDIFLRAT